MNTISTIISGVPVELQTLQMGLPNFSDALHESVADHLIKRVDIKNGNGGSTTDAILSKDNGLRVVSIGSDAKPATPEDVKNVANSVSQTNTIDLIANLIKEFQASGKNWWESKTIWVNLITIFSSLAVYFGFDLQKHGIDVNALTAAIPTILGIVNIILRALSQNKPIQSTVVPQAITDGVTNTYRSMVTMLTK